MAVELCKTLNKSLAVLVVADPGSCGKNFGN
jgi:hypothetical protein